MHDGEEVAGLEIEMEQRNGEEEKDAEETSGNGEFSRQWLSATATERRV